MDESFTQTTLANISIVRQITNELGNGLTKQLGQNFLINQNSLLKFINSIHIESDDTVIEIGPGIGVVTYSLCEVAQKVYCVEIDTEKKPALSKTLENYSNYEIFWADASKYEYNQFNTLQHTKPYKIIGSLPYNVSKRIIYQLITSDLDWSEASFFLQKEVAESYTSRPPQAEFLNMFIQIYTDVKYLFTIPPEHFIPKPKVKTGVIHIKKHTKYSDIDRLAFGSFIKEGFNQPRKTLFNNLKKYNISKQMLINSNLKETVRPSELTIDQWYALFKSTLI